MHDFNVLDLVTEEEGVGICFGLGEDNGLSFGASVANKHICKHIGPVLVGALNGQVLNGLASLVLEFLGKVN